MSRAKYKAFQQEVRTPRNPHLSGGFGARMPDGDARFALPGERTQVVFTALIGGDPNSNGGLDSNGYQKCYLVNYEFGMSGTSQWAEARLDVTDTNSPSANFGDKAFVYAFMAGFTTGASTGTDNGFLLLKPTVGGAGPQITPDINFHLTGTLATSDATAASFAIDSYNPNTSTHPTGTITLANMAASSNYIFSGASGHKGWASLKTYTKSSGNATYEIRQMECP